MDLSYVGDSLNFITLYDISFTLMLILFFRNLHKLETIVFRQTLKWKKKIGGTELSCWQVHNVYVISTSNGFFYAQTNSNIK